MDWYYRFLVGLVCLIFSIFVNSKPVSAESYLYEFESIDEISNWFKINDNSIKTEGGILDVASFDNLPPFIYNNDPFIVDQENNTYKFKFQFISSGTSGLGIALSDIVPPLGYSIPNQYPLHDYSLVYVWQQSAPPYFHVYSSLCSFDQVVCEDNNMTLLYSSLGIDLNSHEITISENKGTYDVILDGTNIFKSQVSTRKGTFVWIGHPQNTLSGNWSNVSIDLIRVNEIQGEIFPFLSQLDPAWKDEEYDTATSWVEGEGTGIGYWGCALTSAAMVLQKYEVKTPSAGADTTPSNLNTWLLSQPDGYVRGGLINWLAVTRYAKLAKDAIHSPTELEYIRKSYDAVDVKSDIDNSLYPILALPGHFIVAYEDQNSDWRVADPLDSAVSTKAKTDEILRSNILKPSNTDLGYFLFVTSVDTKVELRDENGNLVAIDESTVWLAKGGGGTDGPKYKQVYVPKPPNGVYKLYLENTSGSAIPLDIYIYASDGTVAKQNYSQEANKSEVYEIDYDKTTVSQGSIVMLDTTPPAFDNTTVFSGWYNTKKIAEFNYSDLNLLSDYSAPTCEILTEGLVQTCIITPLVCDTSGNCNTTTQISSGADIDLVKPDLELNVWGRVLSGKANDSLSGLKEVLIELTKPGETMSTVKATGTSDWEYVISDAKIGEYKISVTAYDEAGNGSEKIEKSYWINASEEPTAVTMSSTTETNKPLETIIATPWWNNQLPNESTASEKIANGLENYEKILGESTSRNSTKYKDLWLLFPIALSGWLSYYFRQLSNKRG